MGKPNKSSQREILELLMNSGIQCDYVKFQAAVPVGPNKEPVYEFRLEAKDLKYKVERISHDNHTLYWSFDGAIQETPWVNVILVRPIL